MALSPAETAAIITVLGAVMLAVISYGYNQLEDEIEDLEEDKAPAEVEDRVDQLQQSHRETRRLAEASYATVHGDSDRPEDTGFLVESKERWDDLESDIDRLSESVERLERTQQRHQQKTEVILDAVADEMDIDLMFRGDGGGDEQ